MSSFFNFGFQSPKRPLILPSPTSPFSTSPSQLQEVTLDQDGTFSQSMGGAQSPSTLNGPMRGRSVKEFEEKLTNLKKENFNLKLRIYFLEERMGTNFNMDKENVIKKNVELMVELESLRRELKEKHDLLCQAVKAIELEDEEHKKVISEKDEQIAEFQRQFDDMNMELKEMKEVHEQTDLATGDIFSSQLLKLDDNFNGVQELRDKITVLENELGQEKENSTAIQLVLDQKDAKIKVILAEMDELSAKLTRRESENNELNTKLEETQLKVQILSKKIQEKKQIIEDTMIQNGELLKRQAILKAEIEREQKRYERLKVLSDQRIVELQTKLEASTRELKKSQELVVSNQEANQLKSTDDDSFSVSKSTTSPRSPKKNTIFVSKLLSPANELIPSPFQSPNPSLSSTPQTFLLDVSSNISSSSGPKVVFEEERAGTHQNSEIAELRTELEIYRNKIIKLKAEQLKACKIIKGMIDSRNKANEEIKELKQKVVELEKELETVVSKPEFGNKIIHIPMRELSPHDRECSMDGTDDELLESYKTLVQELETKNQVLSATLSEKDSQMKRVQEQYEEILKNLKRQEDHIVDLEFELLSANQDKNTDKTGVEEVQKYLNLIQQKDEEIEILNNKLLKRNCDLQGIVNNELWEKNREIEKLQKQHAFKILQQKDEDIRKLEYELKSKNQQLDVIKARITELGIEVNIEQCVGDVCTNINNNVKQQRKLEEELEKSERLRVEANEICTVLSQRLEELAFFLDSLLKQKSVLGFLGNKENKKLRQIVDQSLDLTKSFSVSMLNPDQSLAELSNITNILNDTHSNGDKSLAINSSVTYKSHVYSENSKEKNEIIEALRQQIVNLKYELQLRDVELGKMNQIQSDIEQGGNYDDKYEKVTLNTTTTTMKYQSDNQSESEAWSEPDRLVSRARIGLSDDLKSPSGRVSSESEFASKSPRTFKRSESKQTILELQSQMLELDQKLNEKDELLTEERNNNLKLKNELENLEIKLMDTEKQLLNAEGRKKTADVEILELKRLVDELTNAKFELMEMASTKDKEYHNTINKLEMEKNEALILSQQAEEIAEVAKKDLRRVEIQLDNMQKQMQGIEKNVRVEYEEKVHLNQLEFKRLLDEIQNDAQREMGTLQQNLIEVQESCKQNCIAKNELKEMEEELQYTKSLLKNSQQEVDRLRDDLIKSEINLKEGQTRINNLRNELDNTTLQYSEAVLEKTKLTNEKANIEQEYKKVMTLQQETLHNLGMLEKELLHSKDNHQKNITSLQLKCGKLEMKLSELETANAELHNRLIKVHNGSELCSSFGTGRISVSTGSNYHRQLSDNSDFDEQPLNENRSRYGAPTPGDVERQEANSSPDLGIESDHGRFSSLETHLNVPRPLLQTLELTESMNNLLDVENNQVALYNCGDERCCKKTMQVINENTDLKRELARTRRILQDTVNELALANKRKKQVEKTICRQIHKTSQVLRKAKANLDSGSETDIYHK